MKRASSQTRAISRGLLAAILLTLLGFSMLIGITGGAIGLGSIYPEINLIASPIACRGGRLAYPQPTSRVGTATYYTATWYCADEPSNEKTPVSLTLVHITAGTIFGLVLFGALFLVFVLYWNSSIGPAKNDGRRLW